MQKNGIAMGLALGPVFSNFYMSNLENKSFNTSNFYMSNLENKSFNTIIKPNIYLRYIDDILLLTNSTDEINIIQDAFQNISFFNFTQDIIINNKIPFWAF